MKKGIFQFFVIFSILFSYNIKAAELTAINFSQKGEISELEFILNSNDVEASKFQIKEDRQIIIDLSNTNTTEKVMRAFDTSQFSGGVVFVKAYKKPKSDKDIRIAVQLRDNVRSVLVRKPNKIILQVENRFGVFSQKQAEEGKTEKETTTANSAQIAAKLNTLQPDSVEDVLENIIQSGKKKYIGKKITMNLRNAIPAEILRMIADSVGFNLVMSDEVKSAPLISLNLADTPWDQVLDTVLEMSKLSARKNGVILIVHTLESAMKEEKQNKEAAALATEVEPMLNRIFPISYADLASLEKILKEYTTEKRGKISVDARTNSLIVKDTAVNIEKMKKMIELLDTQTPQILIEAKIVEVAEKYSKEIGLGKGLSFGYDPFSASAAATPNAGSFAFSTAPDSSRAVFGLNILKFNHLTTLDFNLKLMESEAKAKIISSPKIITKNNVAATVAQTEISYYPETTQSATAGGPVTQTWKPQNSDLSLNVTPQVTNEGSINLKVDVTKRFVSSSGTTGRSKR